VVGRVLAEIPCLVTERKECDAAAEPIAANKVRLDQSTAQHDKRPGSELTIDGDLKRAVGSVLESD
jgi:hypothetical protein